VTIYNFGGLSSEGYSCFAKLGTNKWEELESSQLLRSLVDDIELSFYPTIYIE